MVPVAGFLLLVGIVVLLIYRKKRYLFFLHTIIDVRQMIIHFTNMIFVISVIFLLSILLITLYQFVFSVEARRRKDIYETILPDGQAQYINMTDNLHQYDVIGYKSQRQEIRF